MDLAVFKPQLPNENSNSTVILMNFESPVYFKNEGMLNGLIPFALSTPATVNASPIMGVVGSSKFGSRSWGGPIAAMDESSLYNSTTDKNKLDLIDFSTFTEEFWFKFVVPPSTFPVEYYFGQEDTNRDSTTCYPGLKRYDNKWYAALKHNSNYPQRVNAAAYYEVSTMPAVDTTTWYHYAYQKISSTQFNIYFNGLKLGTWNYDGIPSKLPVGSAQTTRDSYGNGTFRRLILIDQYRVIAGKNLYITETISPTKFV